MKKMEYKHLGKLPWNETHTIKKLKDLLQKLENIWQVVKAASLNIYIYILRIK